MFPKSNINYFYNGSKIFTNENYKKNKIILKLEFKKSTYTHEIYMINKEAFRRKYQILYK